MRQTEDAPIEWAGFRLSPHVAQGHFLMVGATGSGTSLCLHALMASVLRQISPESDRRAVFFDAGDHPHDAIEHLKASGVQCPIHRLDPFASDGFSWDIGADWTDTSMVGHYAKLLIPDPANSLATFFVQSARAILERVLPTLMLKREPWTLADLLAITTNSERLRHTILSAPNAAAAKKFLGPPETYDNTLAVMCDAMEPLREVAEATTAMPQDRRVRFCEWIRSDCSVLVLANDCAHHAAMTVFNKLMFDTLCRQAICRPESIGRWTTWFFLDEVGALPDAENLPRLLTIGRPFGVRIALTCQDPEQVAQVQGSQMAPGLAAHFANWSIFRLTSPSTAAWAASITSGAQTFEYRPPANVANVIDVGPENPFADRNNFLPRPPCTASEFLKFPLVKQGRVYGCHVIPALSGAVLREIEYLLPAV
jgi:hypothetical protein